jgi:galactokinase
MMFREEFPPLAASQSFLQSSATFVPGAPIRCVAPARVNLLGEHTDYTGGLVLPMAIPFFTTASITPLATDEYHFHSDLFDGDLTLSRDDRSLATGHWTDYPVGVLRQLQQRGIEPPAFDLHLSGNVPFGAGLSSSASVEVASALAMLTFTGATLPPEELALLCQRAENDFVHSPCGIMDQFAVTAARAGHALLIHTRDLTFEHLPMNQGELAETQIVVCNSMVRHSVASGEYGVRRRELEAGQAILLQQFPQLRDLGDATLLQLESARALMPHESYLRCLHIISDNCRVLAAREAMFAGDPISLGRFMLAGHASERDNFQCSIPEIDFLVKTAASLPGCFGARLTGGGFGGCTVNLVAREHSESFASALKLAYQQRYNIAAETYLCDAVDGAYNRDLTLTPNP